MAKSILMMVTIFLGALALIGIYRLGPGVDEAQTISATDEKTSAAPRRPTSYADANSSAAASQANKRLQGANSINRAPDENVSQQLEQEKLRLTEQAQQLETLKAQQALQIQQLNQVFPNLINSNSTQITNLSETLESQRMAENDVNRATDAAISQQNQIERLNRDQLDLSIERAEANLSAIQIQLAQPPPPDVVTTTDRQTRITSLKNIYLQQYQQLQLQKEQKANLPAATMQESAAIRSLSQQQKADLAETQSNTQQQIFTLRDDILRLEEATNKTRMSLMPLGQKINQAELDYQIQEKKVQQMETQNPATQVR